MEAGSEGKKYLCSWNLRRWFSCSCHQQWGRSIGWHSDGQMCLVQSGCNWAETSNGSRGYLHILLKCLYLRPCIHYFGPENIFCCRLWSQTRLPLNKTSSVESIPCRAGSSRYLVRSLWRFLSLVSRETSHECQCQKMLDIPAHDIPGKLAR